MIEQLPDLDRELEPVPRLLLTVDQAGDALGVGRDAVYDLMNAGELVSIRIGTRRLVSVEALRRFVERREAEGL